MLSNFRKDVISRKIRTKASWLPICPFYASVGSLDVIMDASCFAKPKHKATLAHGLNSNGSRPSGGRILLFPILGPLKQRSRLRSNGKEFRRSKPPGTRVMNQEQLTAEQRQYVEQFCQASPDLALAYELSQEFMKILAQKKADELSNWFKDRKSVV